MGRKATRTCVVLVREKSKFVAYRLDPQAMTKKAICSHKGKHACEGLARDALSMTDALSMDYAPDWISEVLGKTKIISFHRALPMAEKKGKLNNGKAKR